MPSQHSPYPIVRHSLQKLTRDEIIVDSQAALHNDKELFFLNKSELLPKPVAKSTFFSEQAGSFTMYLPERQDWEN